MKKKNRKRIAWTAAAVVAVTLLAGWAATRNTEAIAPPADAARPEAHEHATTAAVPRIGVRDASAWISSGSVLVIDVRDAESYLLAHVPGALHVPLSRIEGEIPYFQRGRPILTYCT